MIMFRHWLRYFLPAMLIFALACEQQEPLQPIRLQGAVDLFLQGEIREPEQGAFSPFQVTLGRFNEEEGHVFWNGSFSAGALGTTLIMGAYGDQYWVRPLFGFQFWPVHIPDGREMTREEVEAFFAPGTTFAFGQGEGKVDFALRLPVGGPFPDIEASRASFLENPGGQLTIVSLEDYTYQELWPLGKRTVSGKLIRCTLEGQIGRYDREAAEVDTIPWPGFLTDEVVEIINGECVFFVKYR
ncbi:MAG: hypothetical protein KDC54_03310 [Lewinella sp.]|nr:hypothetical protein [Lewinella sp.]